MDIDRVKVLVLYQHALLGEGLERLLSAERGLDVHAVDTGDADAVGASLRSEPDVIVLEDGGQIEPLELMRRTSCPLVIDVSIGSSDAWTIRRDAIRTAPDRLFEVILGACLGRAETRLPADRGVLVGAADAVPVDGAPRGRRERTRAVTVSG